MKLACTAALAVTASTISAGAGTSGRRETKVIHVALISRRTPARLDELRLSIENEFLRVAPRSLSLNLVAIPFDVQRDHATLRRALRASPFFACVSESVSSTIWAAEIPNNIPIIFSVAGDPVLSGLLRPDLGKLHNVTGFTSFAPTHIKRWEILSEAFPQIEKIVVLSSAGEAAKQLRADAKRASDFIGKIEVAELDVHKDVLSQVRAVVSAGRVGVDVPHTALTSTKPLSIIDCLNQTRLPCIYDGTNYAKWGGLLSYEADPLPEAQTICEFLLLLLQDVPADKIPIRYPSSFTLAVNLETAAASAITLKKSLLFRTSKFFKTTDRPAGMS
ncbi:MAG: ABC transporter substrate binding protein [Betaproteobacteria bacterium]